MLSFEKYFSEISDTNVYHFHYYLPSHQSHEMHEIKKSFFYDKLQRRCNIRQIKVRYGT